MHSNVVFLTHFKQIYLLNEKRILKIYLVIYVSLFGNYESEVGWVAFDFMTSTLRMQGGQRSFGDPVGDGEHHK